jgi:glycosyltransferase involved in cell wall biosynthesis
MKYFENNFNIVWSGSISLSWSHTDLLISTAKYLWDLGDRAVSFHVIGQVPPNLSKLMPPNIYCYGPQLYKELPNWLSAMDVGLVLYNDNVSSYGSPIKFFDYMSNSLAVMCTEHPQMRAILAEIGYEEFIIKTNMAQELAEKILYLYNNKHILHDFRTKARDLILHKYSWEKIVGRILNEVVEIYNDKRN